MSELEYLRIQNIQHTDFHIVNDLQEGVGHSSSDDNLVDLGNQRLNNLDLVLNLGTSQNSDKWALRIFQNHAKIVEFLLEKETGALLKVYTDHGGMDTMGSSKSIVDEDITETSKLGAEYSNFCIISLGLVSSSIDSLA